MGKETQEAAVAIYLPEGTVQSIEVHNLGDSLQLGRILERNYQDRMKVWRMIHLGNLLSIGDEIGEAVNLDRFVRSMKDDAFRLLVNRQCIAEVRDEGKPERNRGIRQYPSLGEWGRDYVNRHRYLYHHYWKGSSWLYGKPGVNDASSPEPPVVTLPLKHEIKLARTFSRIRGSALPEKTKADLETVLAKAEGQVGTMMDYALKTLDELISI